MQSSMSLSPSDDDPITTAMALVSAPLMRVSSCSMPLTVSPHLRSLLLARIGHIRSLGSFECTQHNDAYIEVAQRVGDIFRLSPDLRTVTNCVICADN